MIVSRITDGLGNQMFQYALGRSLSVNRGEKLFIDTSWYSDIEQRFTQRNYCLDSFNIKAKIIDKNFVLEFTNPKLTIGIRSLYYRLQDFLPYYKKKIVKEQAFCFDPLIFNCSSNVYLNGFWQSYKYFEGIREVLVEDFRLKNPSESFLQWETKIKKSISVSIHIRRGDYCNRAQNPEHALLNMDYYSSAINYCFNSLGSDFVFYVFSDDLEWAKQHFSEANFCFVSGIIAPEEELILMSTCSHNIIANSTFSWWGAWLNSNPDKVVVAPQRWFENIEKNPFDLLPQSWVKI